MIDYDMSNYDSVSVFMSIASHLSKGTKAGALLMDIDYSILNGTCEYLNNPQNKGYLIHKLKEKSSTPQSEISTVIDYVKEYLDNCFRLKSIIIPERQEACKQFIQTVGWDNTSSSDEEDSESTTIVRTNWKFLSAVSLEPCDTVHSEAGNSHTEPVPDGLLGDTADSSGE